jgi:hypothetical protein
MRALTSLVDYNNPKSLGSRLRARRGHFLIELVDAIHARKQGNVRILDLGGRLTYWLAFGEDYLARRNIHVTLVNVESELGERVSDRFFATVVGDACNLKQFADESFDLVHSNSVIEHVGGWDRVEAFVAEMRRLAPAYYLQTPYFWFPIEPHFLAPFFHWLPESWRAKILLRTSLGHFPRAVSTGEAMRMLRSAVLLDRAQLRYLLSDGTIRFERLLLLPKSLIATKI